jgi:enterochelin esterase-like enzyme
MTRLRGAAALALLALVPACGDATNGADHAGSPTPAAGCRRGPGRDRTAHRGDQRVLVHLPACYDRDTRARYPVVVLVHGSGADASQWRDLGATTTSDELARAGAIAPVILVMPDVGEEPSPRQAADVVSLASWGDRRYRTIADGAHRAVEGISRGGSAALQAAAARPDVYGVVTANSPSSPPDRVATVRGLRAVGGRIRLDVGRDDRLAPSVEALARELRLDGTSAALVVGPGGHDRAYWRRNMAAYLRFDVARWLG